MKRVFLPLFLIGFLCVTLASTEIKAFAFGERAFKVAYDEYLQDHVLPTVYEMTDTGRVELDDKNLGIYFIWKHWYWWNQDWKYWTDYWSETLAEISSKRMGTAIGTLLVEGGSALLGTGITMLVGDLLSLGASLPASVKAVFEAGKLISIALGLTSAGLNTIADTLATDKEDFISIYIAMSGVDNNSLEEARELLDVLEKKKDAIMLADSEIKLIDAMNKIMNLQASTAMLVLEPATLSTIQGLLEIIDDSLLDLATVEIAPRGIKEDVEGLNLFLNASIIHLGLLVDLSRNLDELQSEIQLAESKFDSARMARAVMRAAAIENAYYRVMAGYIRLHLKYLQKDPGVTNYIDSGLSTFRSFIKNVRYYLGSEEETMVTEVKPLPAPINPMPEDGEIDIQIIPSHGHDWVSLMWEMPDTEGRTVTYDVLAGTGRDSLTYIARDLTEKMFFYDGLQEGKEYYWKVIAKDTMRNKSESPVWKFSTVKVGAFLKTPSGIEMVYVEGGPFTMGDTWGDGYYDDERPTHKVTFTYDFYIGEYETTFDEYYTFCESTGRSKPSDSGWGRGQRPVIDVSWYDAIAYCNWLSEKEGLLVAYDDKGNFLDKNGNITTDPSMVMGYRLPIEAEWEYAARGGNNSNGYKYSGSDNVDEVAWYWDNSGYKTHEVGKKAPNELGIYDMSGNVWEWCSDWWDSGYYSKSPTTNPYNSTAGSYRVIRGGGWYGNATDTRVAYRVSGSPTGTGDDLGFRICRTVPYEGENRLPLAPYNPNPSEESIVVGATSVILSWECSDPDGDTLTYDVYFGTNSNPPKVSTNQSGKTLNRSNLSAGTTYYWKVVAKDSKGATTEGSVWKFQAGPTTSSYTPSSIFPSMVLVEKGSFTMGDTWGGGDSDEKPTHKVTFTYDFYMGNYEVTFDEYNAFCEATGRSKPYDGGRGRGSRPVINVSWNDAIDYCNWLSQKEGLPVAYRLRGEPSEGQMLDANGNVTTDITKVIGYRLPTEAEWEYAARGGNKSKGYKYSGSDNIDEVAWYTSNSGGKTQEVGKKAPNELGIYDMSGNVWEWCSDWFGNYSSSAQTNPYNSTAGSHRVYRGGGWFNVATVVRVAVRVSNSRGNASSDLGFRITRTVY